jgi:tetratricopeptide (TPR) repeat protein
VEFELEPILVTSCKKWQCPECGTIFKKRGLGDFYHPGESVVIIGTSTCGKCLSRYPTAYIYGGKYDIDSPEAPRSFLSRLLGRKRSKKQPSSPSSQPVAAWGTREELSRMVGNENVRIRSIDTSADPLPVGNRVVNPIQSYCEQGKQLLAQKRYDEAEECFARAIEIAPKFARAYDGRGLSLAYRDRYEEAVSDYSRAIELDPTCVEAFVHRAVAYRMLKRYEMALVDFERAIEIDPSHEDALWGKATVIEEMGDQGPGRSALSSALREAAAASSDPLIAMASKAPPLTIYAAQMSFMEANSLRDMRKAVDDYPFMMEPEFDRLMVDLVFRSEPQLQRNLSWLRHIAEERR